MKQTVIRLPQLIYYCDSLGYREKGDKGDTKHIVTQEFNALCISEC